MVSKVRPKITKAQCEPMVKAGLIRLEKRGQPTHIVLEDKARRWAVDNFDVKFPPRSQLAPILQALLTRLGHYLNTHQVSLKEVLPALKTVDESDESIDNLIQKIRQAYFKIPDGKEGFRVRLHDLREHLQDLSAQQTNEALLAMQQRGEISLRRAEDLQELTADDEAASIDMGGGDKRYFVRMKR